MEVADEFGFSSIEELRKLFRYLDSGEVKQWGVNLKNTFSENFWEVVFSPGQKEQVGESQAVVDKGGIDFNMRNLSIETKGDSFNSEFRNISYSSEASFVGFNPVIIKIAPISNVAQLTGIEAK